MKKNNKHIGTTTLEDFLREDGTLEEIDRNVQKRLLAMQLQDKMKECSITKYRLAKELHTSRAQIDRILDPENTAVTLNSIFDVAQVLGGKLKLQLV